MRKLLFILVVALCTACSSHQETVSGPIIAEQVNVTPDPGAVEFIYEPPMVDVIDIPPGYDPEGTYYRPAHQEVVEIRQGRWKYYKDPNSK